MKANGHSLLHRSDRVRPNATLEQMAKVFGGTGELNSTSQ